MLAVASEQLLAVAAAALTHAHVSASRRCAKQPRHAQHEAVRPHGARAALALPLHRHQVLEPAAGALALGPALAADAARVCEAGQV